MTEIMVNYPAKGCIGNDLPASHNGELCSRACGYCGKSRGQNKKFCSHACYSNALVKPLAQRFWVNVQKTDSCWIWLAGVDFHGYGQVAVHHKAPQKAHRLAWTFAHGPISSDQHVLHRCDTPRCVNPAHLFLGDQAANMADAASKGRLSVARPGARTLSAQAEADVLRIFARYPHRRLPNGLRQQLAKQFHVSPTYISLIGRRGHVRIAERQHGLMLDHGESVERVIRIKESKGV